MPDPQDPATLTDDEQMLLLAPTDNGPRPDDPEDQANVPQNQGVQE